MPGSADQVLLFVYGTLRRNEVGHGLLRRATFLGEATTTPGYVLLDLGEYPGLVDAGETAVHGELYQVSASCLDDLDEYEGCPVLFHRGPVTLSDGREATTYLVGEELAEDRPHVANGLWPRRDAG